MRHRNKIRLKLRGNSVKAIITGLLIVIGSANYQLLDLRWVVGVLPAMAGHNNFHQYLTLDKKLAVAEIIPTKTPTGEAAICQNLRIGNPGWTDILVTTAFASSILEKLGYQPKEISLGTAFIWKGLYQGDIDIFLGFWQPSRDEMSEAYRKSGKVKVIADNLKGIKYGPATTKTAYDAGLKSAKDVAEFKDKLGGKVYGIDPGSSGNKNMMSGFADAGVEIDLIESSEAAMLTQVERNKNGYVVFLGWEPHWMNEKYEMAYLTGFEKYFGKNFGYGKVSTVVNTEFSKKCPNATKLVNNLRFTLELENQLMYHVGKEKQPPNKVVERYLKQNPKILDDWLKGVKTFDGKEHGIVAVQKALGIDQE